MNKLEKSIIGIVAVATLVAGVVFGNWLVNDYQKKSKPALEYEGDVETYVKSHRNFLVIPQLLDRLLLSESGDSYQGLYVGCADRFSYGKMVAYRERYPQDILEFQPKAPNKDCQLEFFLVLAKDPGKIRTPDQTFFQLK